jgi:hypothetical protein
MPFLPSALDADGVVTILENGSTATTWIGAQGYTSASPLGESDAVGATDGFSGGVAYKAAGEVRLVDATAGVPAGTVICGGFAVNAGRLCYTTDAVGGTTVRIAGVAVLPDGRVHAVITV